MSLSFQSQFPCLFCLLLQDCPGSCRGSLRIIIGKSKDCRVLLVVFYLRNCLTVGVFLSICDYLDLFEYSCRVRTVALMWSTGVTSIDGEDALRETGGTVGAGSTFSARVATIKVEIGCILGIF